MININGQKCERVYSLKTPTKQLIIVSREYDFFVVYKNSSGNYIIIKSFENLEYAKRYCNDINEKLKVICKAEKLKKDIPHELMFV